MAAEARTTEFIDGDGIAIVYDVYQAQGAARGVVQLLHGVGEHAGRYGALIEALTGAGFHVYADDHRGHGRTGIRQWDGPAKLGRLGKGGMRAAVDALWQLTGIIRAEHPELPLVLLGHSWGSFLSQKLLNAHPGAYDAVILSGSAHLTPLDLNALPLNAKWNGPDADGLEWLSRDPEVWRDFHDDPLTTEVPLLKLFGVIDAARLYGRPGKSLGHDVPILLLVGRDDPVGGPHSVHKLADGYRKRSGLTDVATLVYPDGRHEIFNDVDQEQVRNDVLAWLEKHFPAGGTAGK
ncbi:alpha/beta fold hydrolase [Microbacterium sp. NPDC057650]|uniref:alpha/beta fold hydrolase n=1 Tax=unclassified Microbacterium TaxID=2609290 RepID=UPI00366A9FF8